MKRFVLTFGFVLWFSTALSAQIVQDSADLSATDTGADTTYTLSNFTTTTQSNKLLVCFVGHDGGSTANIITYTHNGDSLTLAIEVADGNAAASELWYRKEEDVGTNLSATAGTVGFNVFIAGGCIALYGVDQATTFRDIDSAQSMSATASSLTLTTVSGDWLLDCIFVRNGSTTAGTLTQVNGTEIEELSLNSGFIRTACRKLTAAGTSVTADWAWTNASEYAHVAMTVIPAAADPGPGAPAVTAVPVLLRRR